MSIVIGNPSRVPQEQWDDLRDQLSSVEWLREALEEIASYPYGADWTGGPSRKMREIARTALDAEGVP